MRRYKHTVLYVAGYYGRFIPHLALTFAGVMSFVSPPGSIEASTTWPVRSLWCVFLIGGALLSAYGLRQSDDRFRVVGLFLEGFGAAVYAVALVGLGERSQVTTAFIVALAGFLFKSCIYAVIRLRAETKNRDELVGSAESAHRHGGRARGSMDQPEGLEEQEDRGRGSTDGGSTGSGADPQAERPVDPRGHGGPSA